MDDCKCLPLWTANCIWSLASVIIRINSRRNDAGRANLLGNGGKASLPFWHKFVQRYWGLWWLCGIRQPLRVKCRTSCQKWRFCRVGCEGDWRSGAVTSQKWFSSNRCCELKYWCCYSASTISLIQALSFAAWASCAAVLEGILWMVAKTHTTPIAAQPLPVDHSPISGWLEAEIWFAAPSVDFRIAR